MLFFNYNLCYFLIICHHIHIFLYLSVIITQEQNIFVIYIYCTYLYNICARYIKVIFLYNNQTKLKIYNNQTKLKILNGLFLSYNSYLY